MPGCSWAALSTREDYIARHSYGAYKLGYRRLGQTLFVLSGEGNGRIFYEKVMFTCGGRLINSFAMIYPIDKRHVFDPIVERVEDSFRPARDCKRAGLALPPPARRNRHLLPPGMDRHRNLTPLNQATSGTYGADRHR